MITVWNPGLKEVADVPQFEEVAKLGIIGLFNDMEIDLEELGEAIIEYRELIDRYREERAWLDDDRDSMMYR